MSPPAPTTEVFERHVNISEPPKKQRDRPLNRWYYPADIAHDLDHVDLPAERKGEVLACAWEYSRCVIPQYTNWGRYVAFMRIIIIGIIAEFRGNMVNVTSGETIMGYDLDGVLDDLFHGFVAHQDMAREYKTFLLITSDKTSERRDSELFRRYVRALVASPHQWFRMRDCDALARFTIASALVCNDMLETWYTDEQLDIFCEIGDTMYDAVAFFKHRSEGETNNTFAYMPETERVEAFHTARQVLWAMDVALAGQPGHREVTNFIRTFGGPIHMEMRRYRFVEEQLTIGKPEDDSVIDETRRNFKLWNRVESNGVNGTNEKSVVHLERYRQAIARSDELMFRGLAGFLERADDRGHCERCNFCTTYGTERPQHFSGVQLCRECRGHWGGFLQTLPDRTKLAFPDLELNI